MARYDLEVTEIMARDFIFGIKLKLFKYMYKYVIYKGNNSYLIRNSIEQRGNWTEVTDSEADELQVQFIWKPTSLSIRVIST